VGQGDSVAGKIARGDIRLFRFPEPDKQRPVLVLTRDSIIDRLSRVSVAPVTSTIRGVASEVVLGADDGMKDACAINLHNIVTVPKTGLGKLLVSLDEQRINEVCAAVAFALGCGR
jgi:mRNA interferase MazF